VNPEAIDFLKNYDGVGIRVMEVCGTHTSAIFKSGIRSILSPKIRLISGPGCPVCVTMPSYIDRCIALAETPDTVVACFGDMLKVPGTRGNLSDVATASGGIRMVYSPFEVLPLAAANPNTLFIVSAVGFETTAPAFALLIEEAAARNLHNIKIFPALKSALAAIEFICATGEDVDAFLCPGHVSVITGSRAYEPLAKKYGKPFVVAGFEPEHIASGIERAVRDTAPLVSNLYPEAVSESGNEKALSLLKKYYVKAHAKWRGIGTIPNSGFELRGEYSDWMVSSQHYDETSDGLPPGCRCGDVVLGRIDPDACPLFGKECTPGHAVGPCMVSSEGSCGIWFRNYRPD